MATTPSWTVKDTGASSGQILVGIREHPLNSGLRIKVHGPQDAVGARIEGSFELLEAGDGTYAAELAQFVGQSFMSAAELIDAIQAKGGAASGCRHILNRNKLRME